MVFVIRAGLNLRYSHSKVILRYAQDAFKNHTAEELVKNSKTTFIGTECAFLHVRMPATYQ
jgi:hypothetical protein